MSRALPRKSAAEVAFQRRNAFIESHLALVDQIARKLARKTPPNIEFDDLVQAGRIGLIGAAARYSRAQNVPFGAYARIRIEGEMRELLRRKNRANGECVELPVSLPAPGNVAELERRLLLASILQRLPEAERAVLEAHFFGDRGGAPSKKVSQALEAARAAAIAA